MSAISKIQWTDKTWNPVRGCSMVSPGCTNCYAMRQAHRFSGPGQPYEGLTRMTEHGPVWSGKIRLVEESLDEPLRWKKPQRIFVNSMSDLFHEDVPDEFIAATFGVMFASMQHTFQVLTKRPERMLVWCRRIADEGGIGRHIRAVRVDGDRTLPNFFSAVRRTRIVNGQTWRAADDPWMKVFNAAAFCEARPQPNVWLGVSVENQETADERIPILLQTPAAVRFLSVEPLLGPVDLTRVNYSQLLRETMRDAAGEEGAASVGNDAVMDILNAWFDDGWDVGDSGKKVDWVIVGGESGPGARPCNLEWIRSIVAQCKAAGVPVFVKQLGSRSEMDLRDRKGGDPAEWPEDLRDCREFPR